MTNAFVGMTSEMFESIKTCLQITKVINFRGGSLKAVGKTGLLAI